jgi:hypothetical protein
MNSNVYKTENFSTAASNRSILRDPNYEDEETEGKTTVESDLDFTLKENLPLFSFSTSNPKSAIKVRPLMRKAGNC